jgi:flagellin
MASVINTNMASLVAQKNMARSQDMLATSIERLSSGLRINRAKDDAAGLAISENLLSQIRSTNMAVRNAGDAISMVQTAEGALSEVSTMLQRMRELSTQGNNGSLNSTQRGFIATEINALRDEINKVSERVDFNGQKLLNGSLGALTSVPSVSTTPTITSGSSLANGTHVSGIAASLASAAGTYTLNTNFAATRVFQGDIVDGADFGSITVSDAELTDVGLAVGVYSFAYDADTDTVSLMQGDDVVGTVKITGRDFSDPSYQVLNFLTDGTDGFSIKVTTASTGDVDAVGRDLALVKFVVTTDVDGDSIIANFDLNGSYFDGTDEMVLTDATIANYAKTGAYTFEFDDTSGDITLLRDGEAIDSANIKDIQDVVVDAGVNLNFAAAGISFKIAVADPDNTAEDENWKIAGNALANAGFVVVRDPEGEVATAEVKLSLAGSSSKQVLDLRSLVASSANSLNFDQLGISLNVTGRSLEDILADLDGIQLSVAKSNTLLVPGTAPKITTIPSLNLNQELEFGSSISAFSAAPASDGVYSLSYSERTSELTLTRTSGSSVSSERVNLGDLISNPSANNVINFGLLGISFTVSGDTVDSIGNDLAAFTVNKASSPATGLGSFQVGASNSDTVDLSRLFVDIGISTDAGAFTNLAAKIEGLAAGTPVVFGQLSDAVDSAIQTVSAYRSDFGAMQNRLDYNISNLRAQSENLSASRSRIVDTDYAAETAQLTKTQIMQQAATAMLAQANQLPNVILSLLR